MTVSLLRVTSPPCTNSFAPLSAVERSILATMQCIQWNGEPSIGRAKGLIGIKHYESCSFGGHTFAVGDRVLIWGGNVVPSGLREELLHFVVEVRASALFSRFYLSLPFLSFDGRARS